MSLIHTAGASGGWQAAVRRLLGRPAGSVRRVEVLAPSARSEGTWVFLTGAFLVLCLIYVVAYERYGLSDPASVTEENLADSLLPFQVLFRDLPGPEQRVFRQMQEGVLEMVRMRGEAKAWPGVAALAGDGIPPFARDVIDKTGLAWDLRREGLTFEYIGTPAANGATMFLVRIQEPDPVTGERATPGMVDEEHQLLPDSTLIHITYWKRAADPAITGMILDPGIQGWSQIRVRTRAEEMKTS